MSDFLWIDPLRFAGGVGMYVGSFTKQASTTGNQDITLPTGCPDLTGAAAGTWAVMFWTSGANNVASGTWQGDVISTLGFTTGASNSYAVGASMHDAQATTNTARRMAAKAISFVTVDASAALAEADFVSFPSATTMRINWTTNNGALYPIQFAIFTGLTGAKVVNWTTPTSATSKAVTGVGFSPDLVLHASAGIGSLTSTTAGMFGFGAMNSSGQQWANSFWSSDGVSPSNTSRYQQTDACLAMVQTSEGVFNKASFSSMDADGFTTNFSTTDASSRQVISLCMDGVQSKVGSFTAPAATGAQTITSNHGFTLRGALISTISQGSSTTPAASAAWSLGATDGTNSRAAALFDDDAASPTNADSVWSNTKVLWRADSGRGSITASWSSSTTTSFTISHDSASNNSEHLYLLVG